TAGGVKARRTTVVGDVLELAEIRIQAAKLGLVVIQGVHCRTQVVHRAGSLVPDIRGWGHGVLELVFVLLELGLILLDLLERLRYRLDGSHDVLRQVAPVNDWNPGLSR